MKIAIIGPDGSGKTSVANYLQKNIPNSIKKYAGKKEDHLFQIKAAAFKLWMICKKTRIRALILIIRFFLFYPLEYLENLFKFSFYKKNKIVIFDRHPIDRLVLTNNIYLEKNKKPKKNIGIYKQVEYILLNILSLVYRNFFPKINFIFFLLPSEEDIFSRSSGQYENLIDVKLRIESFKRSIAQLSPRHNIITIKVGRKMGVDEVGNLILKNFLNSNSLKCINLLKK